LKVGVVVEDRFRGVYEGNPEIDELMEPSFSKVAGFRARLCLNLHGGTRSVLLTASSLAPMRAGFSHYRHTWAYNIRIPRAQEILGIERTVHTAEHVASAVFFLGVPRSEITRAQLFAEPAKSSRPYAVIHPMAATPEKTWPAERFLEVARHCKLEPVFIAGPGEDLSAFAAHRCVQGASLNEVKSLLAGASLFVGNDSGPAHMAAAFGLPVVVLFGSSDPIVWAPWKTASEKLVGHSGIQDISTNEVVAALDRLRVSA
jgi:ADP-heptose:LPS heptosyltransferase